MTQKLQTLANLAILVVCTLMGMQIYRGLAYPGHAAPSGVKPGTQVILPGVDWRANHKTVLVVLSPQCHFCSESAPFYRRLVKVHPEAGSIQFVAVMPTPIEASQEYLKNLKIPVSHVVQADASAWGVAGTPTLLLVTQEGKVEKAWTGKLTPAEEEEVIAEVNGRAFQSTASAAQTPVQAYRPAQDGAGEITMPSSQASSAKSRQLNRNRRYQRTKVRMALRVFIRRGMTPAYVRS